MVVKPIVLAREIPYCRLCYPTFLIMTDQIATFVCNPAPSFPTLKAITMMAVGAGI